MTLINTIIAALKSRLAALALIGTLASPALAVDATSSDPCPGTGCDVVAVVSVDADQWGGMTITDANGRTWFLARFKDGPLAEVGSAVEWSDGHAVIAAHDRYLAALARGGALSERISLDNGYSVCLRDGAVTCLYTPVN